MVDNERGRCVVYKRCGCSDEVRGRRLGGRCGRLAEVGHGSWYFSVQVVGASGRRERVRRGGFASAEAARCAGGELLLAEANGPLSAGCTVAQWLRYWLSVVESRLRPSTHRAYRDHVRLHLIRTWAGSSWRSCRGAGATAKSVRPADQRIHLGTDPGDAAGGAEPRGA